MQRIDLAAEIDVHKLKKKSKIQNFTEVRARTLIHVHIHTYVSVHLWYFALWNTILRRESIDKMLLLSFFFSC